MQPFIQFTKVRNVKSPNRGTPQSAGIDFYVPEYDEKFRSDLSSKNPTLHSYLDRVIVPPHCRVLIPSGIHIKIPENTALIANNKSGVATKKGLVFGASVIDSDYQGEVHLHLINTTDRDIEIMFGEKILQAILTPIYVPIPEEVESLDKLYENHNSERGSGGFGSTGTL